MMRSFRNREEKGGDTKWFEKQQRVIKYHFMNCLNKKDKDIQRKSKKIITVHILFLFT